MDPTMRQNVDSTFANLKEGSAGFKTLMEKTNQFDGILASLKTTIENASSITSNLSKITDSIHAGKGTIGMLLMDSTMRHNMDSTVVNVKNSSAELKLLLEKAKESWLLWSF